MWGSFLLAVLCVILLGAVGYGNLPARATGFQDSRDPTAECSSDCLAALLLTNDSACHEALDILTFKAGPEALSVLVPGLRDRRSEVRARSADLLACCVVPTTLVIEPLERAWRESSSSVREHVGKAIFHHLQAVSDPIEVQKHHEFMLSN